MLKTRCRSASRWRNTVGCSCG